jgi:hypothetical protein
MFLEAGGTAVAASPWPGIWNTPYVHGDPDQFASLTIRGGGRHFFVGLDNGIPADAWDNEVCDGEAEAWSAGTLVSATMMRLNMVWRCESDGSIHFATRFLRLNTIGDANPLNDSIAICTGTTIDTCSVVFTRQP